MADAEGTAAIECDVSERRSRRTTDKYLQIQVAPYPKRWTSVSVKNHPEMLGMGLFLAGFPLSSFIISQIMNYLYFLKLQDSIK